MSAHRRNSHPMAGAAGHDSPHKAPESRSRASRAKPCPPDQWDPHGPHTASQRTLARFRAARRPAAAPNRSTCHDQPSFDPARQLLLIELQGDLFSPPSPALPESPAGVFSSVSPAPGRGVAVPVTPPLCAMGGTNRSENNHTADLLDSTRSGDPE